MSIVRGEGVIIRFDAGSGVMYPFACGRSITVNMLSDIVGKSTIGSGDWKEKEKVALDWNFTIEGVVYFNREGFITAPTLYEFWLSMAPVAIDFIVSDIEGEEIVFSGNALITNITTNGAVNNVSSLNVTGEGTGELIAILEDGLMMDSDDVLMEDSDNILMTDNI